MNRFKGWIIYNGNLGEGKYKDIALWINDISIKNGLDTDIVKNNELLPCIDKGRVTLKGRFSDIRPDFVIFWDKDIRLARHLEKMGLKLYNSADAIEICDDKAHTYQVLADNGVPMPKTIIGPKIFDRLGIIDFSPYEDIADELGFPMIIKEVYGSFGAQVYMVNTMEELLKKVGQIRSRPCLFQEYVKSSHGRDIRIHVVGNKVVASMLRESKRDFRANISAGGMMKRYTPSKAEENLAIECARLVGADFAGVDLLFGEDGLPLLCEVNSNAHIKNIRECTGIDVASYIIEHIITDIGG